MVRDSIRRVTRISSVAVAIVFLTSCSHQWDTDGFVGDGTPRYNPKGGWTRYQITFDPINVTQDGEWSFTFTGAPDWTLHLSLSGTDFDRVHTLRTRETLIHASLRDVAGRVLATGGGSLWEYWRLSEPSLEFQSELHARFHRDETYTLYFQVAADRHIDEPIFLTPRLWGGSDW